MRRKKNKKACHFNKQTGRVQPGVNTTVIPVEIVELENNSYHMIVKVEIDGIKGDMIIDTGASVTVIDHKIFPEKVINTDSFKMQSGSVSGQIENVQLIQADHFKIGGRKIKTIQLAGIDLEYVNEMYHKHLNRKIIGLLGCDFCVRYKVIINYRNKEISIPI